MIRGEGRCLCFQEAAGSRPAQVLASLGRCVQERQGQAPSYRFDFCIDQACEVHCTGEQAVEDRSILQVVQPLLDVTEGARARRNGIVSDAGEEVPDAAPLGNGSSSRCWDRKRGEEGLSN